MTFSCLCRPPLTIAAVLKEIEDLRSASLLSAGKWTPSQIFNHCAQSVEFSLMGYPLSESPLFQNTLGRLAFTAFALKGKMTHPLDEPIPGAPYLEKSEDINPSLDRLAEAYQTFERHSGALFPHFSYGALSKSEYNLAHAMHFNNHLSQIQRFH